MSLARRRRIHLSVMKAHYPASGDKDLDCCLTIGSLHTIHTHYKFKRAIQSNAISGPACISAASLASSNKENPNYSTNRIFVFAGVCARFMYVDNT